jgi:hypothetical protein
VSERLTVAEARQEISLCDSFSRLPSIIALRGRMERADWLALLGQHWTICDNVSRFRSLLKSPYFLPDETEPAMMTPEELAALAALPERVTVYRGADRGINERGLSWALERATAARFPTLTRYLARNPVLVTGTVQRGRIVALKLDRGESEVIARAVKVLSVEPIQATPVA